MALAVEISIVRYIVQGGTAKPTGVAIGSTCWDADANILYKTYDGTNWVAVTPAATQAALDLKAPLASPSFTGTINMAGLTASEIVATDASKNLVSLAVATYPSLTELSYVKGVTSALQTQFGLKAPLASPVFTGTVTLPANTIVPDNSRFLSTLTDSGYTYFEGGSGGGHGARILAGGASSAVPGGIVLYTTLLGGVSVGDRFTISGNLATAVATWSSVTHTGFVSSGDLLFSGAGSGLLYGGCYSAGMNWQQASAAQNTWYLVSDADMVDAPLNGITHDGNGKLTCATAGTYLIRMSISMQNTGTGKHNEYGVSISGAAPAMYQREYFGAASEEQHGSLSGIITLTAGQTVEMAIRTIDTGTPTLIVNNLSITVVQIGG